MTPAPPALRANDISMAYGRERIVHEACLTLAPGTVTALVGPNGSGKSTLLRGLTALHRPADGTVLFSDGADAAGLGERELARRIAMLAQSHPDPSGVSVREVVAYGRYAHRGRFRAGDAEGAAVIDRAMAATGIVELADHSVSQLSGGQRQRVWLATCLAQETGVVLLDEPTTFLDVRYQREILEIIRDLAEDGVAVGVVLHDLEQAAEIADEVVLLVHGRILATGAPEAVLTSERLSTAYEVPIDVEPVADGLRIRPQRLRRRPPVSRAA